MKMAPAAFAAGLLSVSLYISPAWGQAASAEASAITLASFDFNGSVQDITQTSQIDIESIAKFYRAYAACSSTCIVPVDAAPDVRTIAEPEVISFITDVVSDGRGILLDGRSVADRQLGYIATSVNVPLALVSPDNPYFGQILEALGARPNGDGYDFSDALPLVVYDAGPTTHDAVTLIGALTGEGYPADKIQYYRGGMQIWVALGLSYEE